MTMLARYKIHRGPRPTGDPLPKGLRQDTRYRTRHRLRPTPGLVESYLATPADRREGAWKTFEQQYLAILEQRFFGDSTPFDQLAELARERDVYLGCSCPTKKNPDVYRCHTVLALRFMKTRYPDLDVRFPPQNRSAYG